MKDSIKDFIGTILVLIEVFGFILLIGFVGGVDQNVLTVSECAKRLCVVGAVMLAAGLALYRIIKDDDRD